MVTGNSSFQCLVRQLDDGDSVAAAAIHDRFVGRLVWLAQQRLEPKLKSKFDASDVVQSVFQSFYRRQADGQFEHTSWGSLWALLAQITVRKCGRRTTMYHAARRDIECEVPLNGTTTSEIGWHAPSREPLPEEVASLEDTMTQLMSALETEQREIVVLKLQNYSHEEIARRVDRTQRTVCPISTRQQDFEHAEELLLEAHELLELPANKINEHYGYTRRVVFERLVELYEAWDKPDRAADFRRPK